MICAGRMMNVKFRRESRTRSLVTFSIPLWIPPIFFAFYYPLHQYLLVKYFGSPLSGSIIPGVSANDISYLYFSGVFLICLIVQVRLKELLFGFWRKVCYLIFFCVIDAILCWFFLQMLLLK